ncbi:MAG: hypothetical protein ACOC0P_00255 [Planctomycetota bacterium]
MPIKRGLSIIRVAIPGLGHAVRRPRLFVSLARPIVPWFPLLADAVFYLSAMWGLVVLSALVMRVWIPQSLLGPIPVGFALSAVTVGPLALLLGFVVLPIVYAKHRPPLGITRITYSFIARLPVLLLGLSVMLGPVCWALMHKPFDDRTFLIRILLTMTTALGAWLVSHWTCRRIEYRLLFDDSDYIGLCHDCGCAVIGPKATRDHCPECAHRLARLD